MQPTDTLLKKAFSTISAKWDNDIIPTLEEYIRIPNKSPDFDKDWFNHGYMQQAMDLIVDWCEANPLKGMTLKVHQTDERTPLLFIEVPGNIDETILLYGHMDKQPEMAGWDEDKGPWKPVIQDGKLYGRGGADDGYAVFASLTALKTLQDNNIPHARCVIIIEGSEESASKDLTFYLEQLKNDIGTPNFIICLDSGCGNYEQLWATTSLRGVIVGKLTVKTLHTGMHSGVGSGIAPATFNIVRELLDRIEDPRSHQMKLDSLKVDIPTQFTEQAQQAASTLENYIEKAYPLVANTLPVHDDLAELLLNRTWRPALSVIGLDGLPSIENAGAVTVPELTLKLSIRIPPGVDPKQANLAVKQALETNPPFNASVSYSADDGAPGWRAPALAPWVAAANDRASQLFYDKPAAYIGEGGTIPFMGMLGDMFPEAQFLIAGVLGPMSNAHGPNEFLHIDMVKKLTGAIASVVASHYEQFSQ